MNFEEEIAKLNEHFFFKEFTFSNNTFRPAPREEVELADSLIWLDDLAVIYQLKERHVSGTTSSEQETIWFEKKVLGRATQQIRDTLKYLKANDQIELENHKGHKSYLDPSTISITHNVVCYSAHDELPSECRRKKIYKSSTAGVIHLFPANDYLGIVRVLLTPSELSEYLSFREELFERWGTDVESVSEPALIGHYLCGDIESAPSEDFVDYLVTLKHNAEEWDMSGVIKTFQDRITTDNDPADYYNIIAEIAKLKRNELRQFKKRFLLSVEKCRAGEFALPFRMAAPRTGCAFVFIPLEGDFIEHRRDGLLNLTHACKYDLKVDKCVGVSFAPEEDGWYSVEWCYLESPWEEDPELDAWLKENCPFRTVETIELSRYDYEDSS